MSPDTAAAVFDRAALTSLQRVCDLAEGPALDDFHTPRARTVLADVTLLVTGWGCPPLDEEMLAAAPALRAVVHSAGSVRGHITAACWDRGIEVTSAATANALPVAEYTVAMILLAGKRVLERARGYRTGRHLDDALTPSTEVGNYQRTVGVLSASLVGRRVIELLRPHDLTVLLYDPYVTAEEAELLGVRTVGLRELFSRSDVVTVHAPLLPTTRGLVGGELLRSMRQDATLINTSRGAVIDQSALSDAVRAGRVRAVLDVTDPEPPSPSDPLWDCDNVLLTPHLAGSQGNELRRLAELTVGEVSRFAAGTRFAHALRRERLDHLA